MRAVRWAGLLGAGLLAGPIGTLVMALLMVAGRYWLGISPPPEAIPDRFAPTLEIEPFFDLFRRFGGYNGLKTFGIRAGLVGLLAVGSLVGVAYAAIVERHRSRRPDGWWRGISPRGLRFVVAAALVLWVASLAVLAPVLDVNYKGLSPTPETVVIVLGLLVAYAGYGAALILTYRFITRPRPSRDAAEPRPGPAGEPIDRRAVVAGVVGAALVLPSWALLRRLYDRATFSYDGLRPPGNDLRPITPNEQFYVVTKNVVDPRVAKGVWSLEVDGHVADPRRYGFDELAAMPAERVEATLSCISNAVGDRLISNAVWTGVPMRRLLEEAGVKDGAVEVVLHGADAYTDTFAVAKALEPTTLVAYRMNDAPLPDRHGYPVRVIVPGLFGEKNITWLTRIEVVDHDAKGFYEQQGWGPSFVIPTRSSIHAPDLRRPLPVNAPVTFSGIAFAGDRGLGRVELSTDDGRSWREATIDYPGSGLSWAHWSFGWRPNRPGEYPVLVRATDGTGQLQTPERRGIISEGATGYHRVVARVEA